VSRKNSVVKLHSESSTQAEEASQDTSLGLSPGDLGAIQDILYGNQLRATNQLIEEMQKAMQTKFEELSVRLDNRITEVEATVETNRKSSIKKLNDQANSHAASFADIDSKLGGSESSIANQFKIAAETALSHHAKASSDLNECRETLSNSIKSTREEFELALKLNTKDIDDRKLDRSALAGLLGGIAGQLSTDVVGDDSKKQRENTKAGPDTK